MLRHSKKVSYGVTELDISHNKIGDNGIAMLFKQTPP